MWVWVFACLYAFLGAHTELWRMAPEAEAASGCKKLSHFARRAGLAGRWPYAHPVLHQTHTAKRPQPPKPGALSASLITAKAGWSATGDGG